MSSEGVRLPRERGRPLKRFLGKSGKLPWESLKLVLKIHSERSSGEVAGELLGKWGEILGSPGSLDKTIFQPAFRLEKLLEGLLGSSGGFGRKFAEGSQDFLEVALVWKLPYGLLLKQTSKNFASVPPQTSKTSLQKRLHVEACPSTVLRELPEALGKSDFLPATRQKCLQIKIHSVPL